MAKHSDVEWTNGTWPIVQGCDYESPGCKLCYAVPLIWRMSHNPNPKISAPLQGLVRKTNEGILVWTGQLALREDRLIWPFEWKDPLFIFVPSHGDLFHPDVPDEFIDKVFAVMALTVRHTYQVLTKRDERMRSYMANPATPGRITNHVVSRPKLDKAELMAALARIAKWPLPNVWLGVSVEDVRRKSRIDNLRATLAAKRFLSLEPLLEDLGDLDLRGIHLAIVGGESRSGARDFDLQWPRRILRQCEAFGTAFFLKQVGAKPIDTSSGTVVRLDLESVKGGSMEEWPEDLRVRQLPA